MPTRPLARPCGRCCVDSPAGPRERGSRTEAGRRAYGRLPRCDPRDCSSSMYATRRPHPVVQHRVSPWLRGRSTGLGDAGRHAPPLRGCRAHLGRCGDGLARITVLRSKRDRFGGQSAPLASYVIRAHDASRFHHAGPLRRPRPGARQQRWVVRGSRNADTGALSRWSSCSLEDGRGGAWRSDPRT